MKKLGLAVIAAAMVGLFAGSAMAAPADKVAVVASTTDMMWCDGSTLGGSIICGAMINNDGATGGILVTGVLDFTSTILQVPYKVSTSGDLIIDVNLECMLFNEVKSTRGGTETSTSTAGLLVFVVIDDDDTVVEGGDGTPAQFIGVKTADTSVTQDDIQGVRFCSRLLELEIGGGDIAFVTGLFVRALIASETTHGFKWVAPNPAAAFGNNLFITLVGVIDTGPVGAKSGDNVSGVGFGKRLMTVESVHLPQGGQTF